ncbi:hypothetical protein PsorP6_000183 [Peronosclerospora sorghi]|uniref:Uncharacterized protein n=1 Tax=Peronosclerospora sorghi TaxID=230839 RepID=A0ACC0WP41_9STRA|nr:hypothetical protein PsorP6_000183 [Peronosclerospora sorghi]
MQMKTPSDKGGMDMCTLCDRRLDNFECLTSIDKDGMDMWTLCDRRYGNFECITVKLTLQDAKDMRKSNQWLIGMMKRYVEVNSMAYRDDETVINVDDTILISLIAFAFVTVAVQHIGLTTALHLPRCEADRYSDCDDLITINYAFPVGAGIMVQSNFSQWREGSLETVAMTIAPWLGVWVGMAAVIATLGEFNVVMACSSRALWATADYKMLPSFLAIGWKRFGTPITAVIFQTVTTGVLMTFSFEILVVIDTFFNNMTLLLEFFAFLRLKYVEKDAERPFVVPFGNAGAWAITLPKVLVLAGVLIAQKRSVWVICGMFNVIISSAYLIWCRFQPITRPNSRDSSATTAYGTSPLS